VNAVLMIQPSSAAPIILKHIGRLPSLHSMNCVGLLETMSSTTCSSNTYIPTILLYLRTPSRAVAEVQAQPRRLQAIQCPPVRRLHPYANTYIYVKVQSSYPRPTAISHKVSPVRTTKSHDRWAQISPDPPNAKCVSRAELSRPITNHRRTVRTTSCMLQQHNNRTRRTPAKSHSVLFTIC
jgi:hypothetical protein